MRHVKSLRTFDKNIQNIQGQNASMTLSPISSEHIISTKPVRVNDLINLMDVSQNAHYR